jgi:hypothetical protein
LEVVQSPEEFGLRVGQRISVGTRDSISMGDEVIAEVVRNGVIIESEL